MTNDKRNLFFLYYNILKILGLAIVFFAITPTVSLAQSEEVDIAYQLAVLHTKQQNPETVLTGESLQPNRSVIAEFRWILDGLKSRCLNPEQVIASTILQSWQRLNHFGERISLLDVARQSSQVARNRALFGYGRVNFRMTTNYWLKTYYPHLFPKEK